MDMDSEVTAIVDFINHKWSPIPDLEKLVTKVRDQALYDGRAWFAEGEFSVSLIGLGTKRLELVESVLDNPEKKNLAFFYDNVRNALEQFRQSAKTMHAAALTLDVDDNRKHFEQYTKPLFNQLRKEFPGFSKSKPLGWAEFAKNYTDYAGQQEYRAEPDRELYQGVDPEGRSWHLVEKLALPYLMYDDKCQGNSPTYMLVSSIYSHFLGVNEFINTKNLIKAVKKNLQLNEPGLSFDLRIKPKTGNSHLDILVAKMQPLPTRQDFFKSLNSRREFEALSEEEKAERKRENAVRIKAMMENVFSRDPDPDPEADKAEKEKEDAELLEMKRLMRAEFSGVNPSAKKPKRPAPDAGMEP